jgi:hypothetical protein
MRSLFGGRIETRWRIAFTLFQFLFGQSLTSPCQRLNARKQIHAKADRSIKGNSDIRRVKAFYGNIPAKNSVLVKLQRLI